MRPATSLFTPPSPRLRPVALRCYIPSIAHNRLPTTLRTTWRPAAFCEAAQRFATSERVHCLKVVSDNPQSPYQTLNAEKVEALIEAQLDTVAQVGEHLRTLSQQLHALHADLPGFAELTAHWQFTATQQHQLRGLLLRWQALVPETPAVNDALLALQNRDEVLAHLKQQL